uniref:DNA binding HTH domain-containing protein n=1 Tax=candidate division WOR-3 bacterium TaxID=2052148 RepID=A0A7V0Z4D8_UNCW3
MYKLKYIFRPGKMIKLTKMKELKKINNIKKKAEEMYIRVILNAVDWRLDDASKLLNMSKRSLCAKIKRLHLKRGIDVYEEDTNS